MTAELAPASGARPIFIDALNLAYWCGDPPSLRLPLTLMSHLLAGGRYQVRMYFDASARYRLVHEADEYTRLLLHSQLVVEVPSGRTADGVMLRYATSSGASIVGRDRFRDHRRRYRKLIDDPARLISGTVEADRLRLPALAIDVPLAASIEQAWAQLEPLLPMRQKGPAPARGASSIFPEEQAGSNILVLSAGPVANPFATPEGLKLKQDD